MGLEILRVENIEEKYQAQNGEVTALENISFSMDKGEFMSIVGPSGCGKSTLLSILAGLLKPTAGAVYVKGEKVEGISGHIGYMLQKDSLLDWRTIYSNVLFGLEVRHMLTQETVDRAVQLLKTYGLYEFKDKYPAQLSGGMRQRAALIRTLALKPDLLLLDEPFSALDYQTRLNVSDDIGKILKKQRKPAILVTHDISEAISMADRVLILSKRPATVIKIVPIDLDMKDRTPLASRNAPAFKSYFNLIWKELNQNA